MSDDTQRLIGLLETALQALLVAQQAQLASAGTVGGQAVVAAAAPAAPEPAAPKRTLGEWLDLHWAQLAERGYKPQTLRNRGANMAHVRRIWGARPIDELRPHEVAKGLKEFLPKRTSTAKRVLGELRDALTEAIANDWAQINAAASIKLPAHKNVRKRLKLETWRAMLVLAKASRQSWLLCLLLLAVVTAQRRADLAKMRFDDIITADDGQQYLRVQQQKEAGKGFGARIEVPLSLRLEVVNISLRDVVELCAASGKPGPTLLRKANGTGIEVSSLSARFHEAIVAVCGPDAYKRKEWPSLHEARSLSARLYDFEGHDVQTLLGHCAKEMTELYLDDRGLTAREWKRVQLPVAKKVLEPA